MRGIIAAAIILAAASAAQAQNIDTWNAVGPSGTHFNLELPCSSYTYNATTSCIWSYRHTFQTFKNGVLKTSETFDVINPPGLTPFQRVVSFSGWNLAVGDVVLFRSTVVIISGPYTNQADRDYLYGDVVDLEANGWRTPRRDSPSMLAVAIDDRRRAIG